MNGRRAIVGLCMLCALLVSAFAAQSASAVNSGTVAFTCVKGGGLKDLRGAHCLKDGTAEEGWGHVPITEETEIKGTNANSSEGTTAASTGRLKVTIAGVPLELGATTVSGSGTMKNTTVPGSEHFASGGGTITFTGVAVTTPAGRGCKVFTDQEATKTKGEEGVVHTRPLVATTKEQGHFLKFEPEDGPLKSFANFFVECEAGKQIPAIEGTWECIGTVKGVPTGATTHFDQAAVTAQNTLKCKGAKAGIEGDLTLEGSKINAKAFNPLAATTQGT